MTKQIGNLVVFKWSIFTGLVTYNDEQKFITKGTHTNAYVCSYIFSVHVMYVHSLMVITAAHCLATNTQALKHLLLWN